MYNYVEIGTTRTELDILLKREIREEESEREFRNAILVMDRKVIT